MFDEGDLFVVIVSFPLIWGRMRYAPTPVRLYCGVDWFGCRFHIRSFEGVCDTPLRCSRGFWACVEWLVGVGLFVLKQLQHDVGGTLGGTGGT